MTCSAEAWYKIRLGIQKLLKGNRKPFIVLRITSDEMRHIE
jgi:hypothetical protein